MQAAFLIAALTKLNKTNDAINSIQYFLRKAYNFSNFKKSIRKMIPLFLK